MDNTTTIIDELVNVRKTMAEMKAKEKSLIECLVEAYSDKISEQMKDYGCGTATLNIGQHVVKVEYSKNVKWDQSGLIDLWNKIASSGQDPSEYIKAKYEVSETAYKAWPSEIRDSFEPFRTVTPSSAKITIKE